jgi:hypothetical protein
MNLKYFFVRILVIFIVLLHYGNISFAGGDESRATAEKLLKIQLEAIVKGDHQKFIQPGNDAFKKMYDEWHFDSIKSQRGYKLKKGYTLKYLGVIKRLGAKQHLWKVLIADDKYEYLASITITYGMVVGFDLD